MKRYQKKFLCGATLRVDFGKKGFLESAIACVTIYPGDSVDIKVTEGKITIDMWYKQLEKVLADVQKKLKEAKGE
jgi:hypothetical protein